MSEYYIGLMSGTSADGIDAALVDFSERQPRLAATHYTPYSSALRQQILELCVPGQNEIQRMGELDVTLGKAFANAAAHLLNACNLSATAVKAIGSHGQTIRHHPHAPHFFTLQIGDPNIIAAETGITTIADFRRKDIANGGHGAPLVPAFHDYVLRTKHNDRAIVNIGGIANVTLLPSSADAFITGFDTGPGNVLLDAWIQRHQQLSHDKNGDWGAQGNVQPALLASFLADPYFHTAAPKSTGREYFNTDWLDRHLKERKFSAVDVQATLTELTAASILDAVKQYMPKGEILVCGGGAHNAFLMKRLQKLAHETFTVDSTAKYGIDPDWMEAMAFAWLARQTLNKKSGSLPSVTGAKQPCILGGIYHPH